MDTKRYNLDGIGFVEKSFDYYNAGMIQNITYKQSITATNDTEANLQKDQDTLTQKELYTYEYNDLGQIHVETSYSDYMVPNKYDTTRIHTVTNLTKTFTYYPTGDLWTTQEHQVVTKDGDDKSTNKTTTYTYDNTGNRKTFNDGKDGMAYTYDRFGRLEKITKGDHDDNIEDYMDNMSYMYDAQGRTKTETSYWYTTDNTKKKGSVVKYNYYASGQLGNLQTEYYNYDQDIESSTNDYYYYDGNGQRNIKITGADVTKYYYTGGSVLFTLDESNVKTSENIISTTGEILAGKRFIGGDKYADKWFSFDYDLRGSVTAILDPDGAYTKGYQYDEFGNTAESGDGDFYNETAFTGCVADSSSGLYYMNARYYNPKTGRFLTQDVIGGDNWTNNLYSYCGNNPVSFIDPTGYDSTFASMVKMYTNGTYPKGQSKSPSPSQTPVTTPTPTPSQTPTPTTSPSPTVTKLTYPTTYDDLAGILFPSEEDAAAAFLASQIPETDKDGKERSAWILERTVYVESVGGAKIPFKVYQLTEKAYVGGKWPFPINIIFPRAFIGVDSALEGYGLAGKKDKESLHYSMVHTHPSGSILDFSAEDIRYGFGDWKCDNVYMGMAGDTNRGVYKATPSGRVLDPNGNLKPISYY